MRLLDAEAIRVLTLIAQTGRFSAAASATGVTQPSVSQQVRRIEGHVGRELFQRRRSGVVLTAAGEAVIAYGQAMLGLTEDLRRALTQTASGRTVGVGMAEDFCRTALPSVLWLMACEHPDIHMRLISGSYDRLVAALEDGAVDFVIARQHPGLGASEVLYRDDLCWIGAYDLTLPIGEPVPLVMPLAPSPSRETALACLEGAGRAYVIRFESTGIAGMEMALGAGMGVAAGPSGIPLLGASPLSAGHGLPALPQVEFVISPPRQSLCDAPRLVADLMAGAAREHFMMPGDRRRRAMRLMDPAYELMEA